LGKYHLLQRSAGSDRRNPIVDGVFNSWLFGFVANGRAIIIDTVGHNGPSIISTFYDVDFVSAFRSVLLIPNSSCSWVWLILVDCGARRNKWLLSHRFLPTKDCLQEFFHPHGGGKFSRCHE
jgi:hypothetical protein